MGRKHCNLQCFGTSCLAKRLEPLLQHRKKTLLFIVFWSKLCGQKAGAIVKVSYLARRPESLAIWGRNTKFYSVLGQVV